VRLDVRRQRHVRLVGADEFDCLASGEGAVEPVAERCSSSV
jgi:hypothetical protein